MEQIYTECLEKFKVGNCKTFLNVKNHEGTETKYIALEKYVEAWFEKTIKFYEGKYEYLIFNYIDVFAGTGISYDTQNESYIEGTIARVIKLFLRKAEQHPQIKFRIYANDESSQSRKCLSCYYENVIGKILPNFDIKLNCGDYRRFINGLDLNVLKTVGNKIANINLIFYDPYKVDFDWIILKPLFSLPMTDIVINHIFPNHAKRGIDRVKDERKIENYEQAYGVSINHLRQLKNLEIVDDKDKEYRRLFRNQLIKHSLKKYIGYAPVISSKQKHTHVFDLVVASDSNKACVILKDEMYRLYKDWIKEPEADQLSLNLGLEEISRTKKTEFNFRYDVRSLANILINEYGGKTFSKEQFEKILEKHEYLPSNCKNELRGIKAYKIVDGQYIVSDIMSK